MNNLKHFLNPDFLIEPDDGGNCCTLKEEQGKQKQQYRINPECVVLHLDNQKIKWFLKCSSTMCDYVVLKQVKDNDKKLMIHLVCIELKSTRPDVKKACKQLEAGELLCKYLIEILNTTSGNHIEIKDTSTLSHTRTM